MKKLEKKDMQQVLGGTDFCTAHCATVYKICVVHGFNSYECREREAQCSETCPGDCDPICY